MQIDERAKEIADLSQLALEKGADQETVDRIVGGGARLDKQAYEERNIEKAGTGLTPEEKTAKPEYYRDGSEEKLVATKEDIARAQEVEDPNSEMNQFISGGDSLSTDTLVSRDEVGSVRTTNKNSEGIAASKIAMLQEDSDVAVNLYENISIDNVAGQGSFAQDDATKMFKQFAMGESKSMFGDVLTDPTLSDDAKKAIILEASDPNSEIYSVDNQITAKAIIADSNTDSTVSGEQRLSLADSLQRVNAARKEEQKIANAVKARLDTDTVTAFKNFMLLITPMVEPIMVGQVYEEFKKEVDVGDTNWLFDKFSAYQKTTIKQALENAPLDQQKEVAKALADIIDKHSGLPLLGDNDVQKAMMIDTFLTDRAYDTTDQTIDAIVELLDLTIVGGIYARIVKKSEDLIGGGRVGIDGIDPVTWAQMRNAGRSFVRSPENPSSTVKLIQDANPESARDMHKMISDDPTDATAKALTGLSRDDAIVDDIAPQVASVDGSVQSRVSNLDLKVNDEAIDLLKTGELERTIAEKEAMRIKYFTQHENIAGMSLRREMTQIGDIAHDYTKTNLPDGVRVNAVYGPAEGGFNNAQDAVDMALWAMRDLGVTEKGVQLLVRDGSRYVPTTVEQAQVNEKAYAAFQETGASMGGMPATMPDYLIQVTNDFKFKDSDVGMWSDISITNNIFDRVGAASDTLGEHTAGMFSSIQNYALDPASMIDPTMFKAASAGVARAAAVEKEILVTGGKFAKGFSKLPRKRQVILEGIIKNNNKTGVRYTETQAMADGLSAKEISVLADWKQTWDTMYALENSDAVRSLRNSGYKEFIDTANDTKLYARPLSRNGVRGRDIYDPATGKEARITKEELDALYDSGGTIATLRNPVEVGGRELDMVVVPNTKGGVYLRELSDDSVALNYREGYYAVRYKDPYFIDKQITRADGTTYTRAVATAGSKKDGELLKRRLEAEDPEGVYGAPRGDVKGSVRSETDSWDLAHNTGRSAQRARGERLTGLGDEGGIDPTKYAIEGPVESMLSSARSISNRVSLRKVIETSKSRWIDKYGHLSGKDARTQLPIWPNKVGEIKFQTGSLANNRRDIADARTAWNYVNYLENGYINMIDAGYKAALTGIAKMTGSFSSNVEKSLLYMADTRGPTAVGKNLSFTAYLALNPMRQALIQSHQAVQLAANFGKDVHQIPRQIPILVVMQLTGNMKNVPDAMLTAAGLTRSEADQMWKAFNGSGIVSQIDKQNLVRAGYSHLADSTIKAPILGKAGAVASNSIGAIRKIGFDAGENAHMMSNFLAHYNRARRQGLDLSDQAVLDNITADAINYGYNMNAAGDMKYNVDGLALVFQYVQVPHKALLQMTTNRILTKAEKSRLIGYNIFMYGVPPGLAITALGLTEETRAENPDLYHALVFGWESMFLNKMLNDMVGTETDFSASLAPTGAWGLYETISNILTTDIMQMYKDSPAGKLVFGDSPRLTDAFKSIARAFGVMEDHKINPTTLKMAATQFVKISSGMSNAFQGIYMNEVNRTMNGLDRTVTEEDAWRKAAFGLVTVDESNARHLMSAYYKNTKQQREDVKTFFVEYKKQLTRAGITQEEFSWSQDMLGEAWRVWGKNPEVHDAVFTELHKLIQKDLARKDIKLVDMLIRMSGIMLPEDVMAFAQGLPESDAYDKQQTLETFKYMMEGRKNDDDI